MSNGFEDFQKVGKENVDLAVKSVGALNKGFQSLASEAADYSKQSFDAGSAAFEKLLAVSSLDKAVEVQSAFLRSAYEGYVGQVTRIGEILTDMAKDAYKPYENILARNGK